MKVILKALELIRKVEFVEMATADASGKPNSAPKFFLKTEGLSVYLIDYSVGRSAENIRVNPRVALSFIMMDTLTGYRLSGRAEIIRSGDVYNKCLDEMREKAIDLTTKRIIEGVREDKPHKYKAYELEMSGRILIYKINVEEGSEISPRGEIERDKAA